MANTNDDTWWRGAVMYQIYPRSFLDTTGNGVGDLRGITKQLEYVASLGVAGIWISPFFMSPMKDYGYDVADYKKIDPLFGTNQDFEDLLNTAHKLSLKVIIDMVMSHTSDAHPWFKESRSSRDNAKADWYVWADPKPDGTPPNNWRSVFGGESWQFDTSRGQYYLHNFLKEQPDLNYHNPDVRAEMVDTARYWLELGVDGFRLDAINFIYHDKRLRNNPPASSDVDGRATQFQEIDPYSMQRHVYDKSRPEAIEFLKKLRELSDCYNAKMWLAEVGDTSTTLPAEYTDGPELLHTAYSFGLLGNEKLTFSKLKSVINDFTHISEKSWPSWAFSNHDVIRPATRWGRFIRTEYKQDFTKTLIALLCSLRGTIFIYQGEELGLEEAEIPYEKIQDPWGKYLWPKWQGRDGCRTPIPWSSEAPNAGFTSDTVEPWLPIPPDHRAASIGRQKDQPGSVLEFAKEMIRFRNKTPALFHGAMQFLKTDSEALIAFTRTAPDTKNISLLCLFNLSEQPLHFSPDGLTLQDNARHIAPSLSSTTPGTLNEKRASAKEMGEEREMNIVKIEEKEKISIPPCGFFITGINTD